jgi:regulator of protease activity HflC (stomatin/prohibitin superfamily)
MKAEREKRAAVLEAEGLRAAAILRAEGMKQAAVLEAEGRRDAAMRDAEARERLAQAEAEATRMLAAAIGEGGIQAANYFVAQKYIEAFGKFATSPNQKTLILPMEATAALGSLAGIAELTRDALAQNRPSPAAPWGPRTPEGS